MFLKRLDKTHKMADSICISRTCSTTYRGRMNYMTSFWQLVYHSLTVGTQEKVPCIRHELQKAQWEAIARVIVYGVKRYNYFPIFLSRAVIASVLLGEGSIPSSFLLESFLLYVSQEERETILIALGDKFDPNDGDLLDFLSNFKCFTKVTAGNISRVIHELAHQELLQKPRYIIHCFVPILSVFRAFPAFQNLQGLQEMYLEKKPTPKKIIKLLDANPQNEPERMALDHLKRYIRSLDGQAVVSERQTSSRCKRMAYASHKHTHVYRPPSFIALPQCPGAGVTQATQLQHYTSCVFSCFRF